jgi:hypothetical protein
MFLTIIGIRSLIFFDFRFYLIGDVFTIRDYATKEVD